MKSMKPQQRPGWTANRKPRHTQALRLLAEAIAAADEAITVADLDGYIIDSNDAVERIYRWPKKEIIGCHPLKFFPTLPDLNWDDLSRRIWTILKSEGQWTGVVINHDQQGRRFPILLKTRRITAGRTSYVLSFARPFPREAPFGLSARGAEIFTLLGQGRVTGEIAAALHRKESTIRSHLKRIWKKAYGSSLGYNLPKLTCLALRCLEAGWDSGMKLANRQILKRFPQETREESFAGTTDRLKGPQ